MSEINVDTIKTADGSHEKFPCTAWVQFDGTGTPAINDSGNVSSLTDSATGIYVVNFATAMDNANYSALGSGIGNTVTGSDVIVAGATAGAIPTTGGVTICTTDSGTGLVDRAYVHVAIFGGLA